jgi:hypothetical protein
VTGWTATTAPGTPAVLQQLDGASRADHIYLSDSDRCAFLTQYVGGRGYRAGGCNQLLRNFKCRPSLAAHDARLGYYKRRAIECLARWLRAAVPRRMVEACTWVPIPPSRQPGDPDFDDRLLRTLRLAFGDYDLDLRALLRQTRSTASDHAGRARLSEAELLQIIRVDGASLAARPLRARIVLFDDVLTSGKHFRCCARRLGEVLPGVPVAGVFLMRRAPARAERSLGRAW